MIDVRQPLELLAGCFRSSNLIGMGVLSCELPAGTSAQNLALDGTERRSLSLGDPFRPRRSTELGIERVDGRREAVPVALRLDTQVEAAYLADGGILPYVLDQLFAGDADAEVRV